MTNPVQFEEDVGPSMDDTRRRLSNIKGTACLSMTESKPGRWNLLGSALDEQDEPTSTLDTRCGIFLGRRALDPSDGY
jgi:hypothetical protein